MRRRSSGGSPSTGLVEVSPHPGRFIGTVMFERGRLVFHVFDVGEAPPAA
jgi:hypothetical protein